jgi:hypothetical protein
VAGYSETALATKLGIKSNSTLVILSAPSGLSIDLPLGTKVHHRLPKSADVVFAFFTSVQLLERRLEILGQSISPSGGLWIAWPKKASGLATDITQHVVRDVALPIGLVDNKVCAIDETWSSLRLVWRKECAVESNGVMATLASNLAGMSPVQG